MQFPVISFSYQRFYGSAYLWIFTFTHPKSKEERTIWDEAMYLFMGSKL